MIKIIKNYILNFSDSSIIKYYIIGGCIVILGYLVFTFIYFLTEDILISTFTNLFVTFVFRFYFYKNTIFKKLNFIYYSIFYILLLIFNNIFLNFIIDYLNIYLAQLFYIILFSVLIYNSLKKCAS